MSESAAARRHRCKARQIARRSARLDKLAARAAFGGVA